jgi:hypothetical protein
VYSEYKVDNNYLLEKVIGELMATTSKRVGLIQSPTMKKADAQFMRTAENLRRKGKTNKKLKSNPKAKTYN